MRLQTLARDAACSAGRAETFLLEMANLRLDPLAAARVLAKFPEFFPPTLFSGKVNEFIRKMGLKGFASTIERVFGTERATNPSAVVLLIAHAFLRPTWEAPSPSTALWRVFYLRLIHKELTNPDTPALDPPLLNPFEFSLLYLMNYIGKGKALKCPNSECVTPYFFAKKKGQKYCGPICSDEAQKETKRQWWDDYGKQRRKEKAIRKELKA